MLDVLMSNDDLDIDENGDITLTESVVQAAVIRLRWFLGEWKLGKALGLPYFEDVFVKNPNHGRIKTVFRAKLMEITEVDNVINMVLNVNAKTRTAKFTFDLVVGEDVYSEEVEIYG